MLAMANAVIIEVRARGGRAAHMDGVSERAYRSNVEMYVVVAYAEIGSRLETRYLTKY